MIFIKSSSVVKAFGINACKAPVRHSLPLYQCRSYAQQSYGGGEGDPKGERPQDQGANPSAGKEHPGPPPPAEGRGTGGGPTKAEGKASNAQQKSSGGSSGASGTKQSSSGAQPKIHSTSVPTETSEEVKKHNEEMEKRHDKAANRVDDKEKDNVGKGYWAGQGGADQKP